MHRKNKINISLLLALVLGLISGCIDRTRGSAEKAADMILTNGAVYTVDANSTMAQAVAVKEGKIVFVGSSADAEKYKGASTKVINLNGKMVMPSFFDTHCHVQAFTGRLYSVNLGSKRTLQGYKDEIRAFLAANPNTAAIKGIGWSNTVFPNTGPNKKDLDEITTAIPISINSEDGHSIWVNSRALKLANITKNTKDPEGGVIERDASGEPSGVLREAASSLVVLPDYSVDQYKEGIRGFQEMAARLGITGVQDALLEAGSNAIEAYKALADKHELAMRVRGAYFAVPERGAAQVNALIEARGKDNRGDMFQMSAIKFAADGVIEGITGYLLEPYAAGAKKPAKYRGAAIWKPDNLGQTFAAAEKAGFQIHVHSIGDAATQETLDALTFAEQQNGKGNYRNIITHLQLVDPSDFRRFKDLRVIAAINPIWAMKDEYYYALQVPYLGIKRAEKEYPVKSFIDNGVLIASASDFPVTYPPNPLDAIQVGVTRTTLNENLVNDPKYKLPLWPEERAGVKDMIASVTYNAAYANFLEKETGSIEVGKSADLIVIDKNLLDMPATDIHKTQVLMTFFKGKEIYRVKESPSAKVQTGTYFELEKDGIAEFQEVGYVGAN